MSAEVAMCIARNCPHLKKLEGCIDVTDMALIEFGKHCPKLTDIWLTNATRWTDTGVVALIEACHQLKDLCIENDPGHDGITDVSILKISESCQQLKVLGLYNLSALTDESLYAIERNCKRLVQLNLGNLLVSNAALKTLCASPNLNSLEIIFVESLDIFDDAILELVKNHHSTLKSIEIYKCNDITDVAIYFISQHCTHLTKLVLSELPYVCHPIYIADILRRNPKLVDLSCKSLGPQNRIVDEDDDLVPMLQTLLDENKSK
jgi:hypothetical protein